MSEEVKFYDILIPRRGEASILQFMSKPWHPRKTYILEKSYSPQELKDAAARSVYLDAVIEAESARTGVNQEKLKKEVQKYLDEMGLEKKQCVIRWMGIFFLKVSFMMKIGIFVNERAVLKLKSTMGNSPVLFLPTHRSYADFCVMTYLCYHYDIDFPAVAAGMDFYSMAVVGRCMRDTCAFYIRRTLGGERLYAATLKQYVRTIVAKHCAPIEFFLEGTRSRSNKSLPPKYGMLSMSMVPLFAGEVSDMTVVPVNISYDRLMEHELFAYEHLGVPKPKESTGHLLKALRRLNDHFGNIYINLGEPLSLKEYVKNSTTHSNEILKPLDLQQLTSEQFSVVQDLANHVVNLQQKNTVVTITNLVALVVMQSLMKDEALGYDEVLKELQWMIEVLGKLGALVFETDLKGNLERMLLIHNKLIKFDKERKLKLISSLPMDISNDVKKKMKGHTLQPETMMNAVPVIELQLYVNPVLHFLVPPAVVSVCVGRGETGSEQLSADYRTIRTLLSHEFLHVEKIENQTLSRSLQYCLDNDVVSRSGELYVAGGDEKLQFLLRWSLLPALTALSKCAVVMREQNSCEHKYALKLIQERVETSQSHPYCLSLESTANCLQGLVLAGALIKGKTDDKVTYELQPEVMERCCHLVNSVLPVINVDFGKRNSVILEPVVIQSRL